MRVLRLTLVIAMITLFLCPEKNLGAQSSGPQIVFTATRGGESFPKLYIMNANGTNARRLGALPGTYSSPQFTPDNRRIVFAYTSPDFDGNQICIINASGSGETCLGKGGLIGLTPAGRIIYGASSGNDNAGHTYLMELDGSQRTEFFLDAPGIGPVLDPVFGPGGVVAFTNMYNFTTQIYTMQVNGQNLRRLTTSTDNNVNPAWSPDGSRIAYANKGPSTVPDGHEHDGIYIMNADGSHARRVVAINFGQDLGPENSIISVGPARYVPYLNGPISFSPDGAMLAYSVDMARRTRVYIVNSDGSGLSALTTVDSGSSSPSFSH